MLMAFLGLWIIRRVLLGFFKEGAVAGALVIVVFGSNYLDYSSMNAAMTHNYLFTVYAGLLALTISFYENPSYRKAAGIGALVGLAALTRPTEILSAVLPLMWGLYFPLGKFLRERLNFLRSHLPKFLLAAMLTGAVGFLQLLYWKWVGGDWLIYSYQDQGFSWLHPHIMDCLFSYRAGWWIYSPLMVLPLVGFPFLAVKNQRIFWPSLAFSFLFMYVTFAWDIWWYGGSLGQRAMVQAYAVLLLPLTALTEWVHSKKILPFLFYILVGLGIYHNLWITHQAHKGGLFVPEQVTERYFKNILWRYEADPNVKLLLDNSEGFLGEPRDIFEIAKTDLEADSLSPSPFPPIQGQQSLWVSSDKEFSDNWTIPVSPLEKDYLRLQTQVRCISKEWEWWRVPQVIMELRKEGNVVKSQIIRPHRHMNEGETMEMNVDMKLPGGDYDQVKVYLWNAGSNHPLLVDQLVLLAFDD